MGEMEEGPKMCHLSNGRLKSMPGVFVRVDFLPKNSIRKFVD